MKNNRKGALYLGISAKLFFTTARYYNTRLADEGLTFEGLLAKLQGELEDL
jgi:hypothetical protein